MILTDYIIIGIVILYALNGFMKGFRKYFFGKVIRIGAVVAGIFLASTVSAWIETTPLGDTINANISAPLGNYVMLAAAFLIVVIAIILFFKIVRNIFKGKESSNPGVGIIDRILGLVFGLVRAFITIEILLIILVLLVGVDNDMLNGILQPLKDFVGNEIRPNEEGFAVTRTFYGVAQMIIDYFKATFTAPPAQEELAYLLSAIN